MDDVFISYAREDRARVQGLVQALEARGLSIWIDHSDIPLGATFDDVIERALDAARCVIVVWTAHSVASRWVRSEASAALDRDRLVPVLFEPVPIPLEFRRVQTADLSQWRPGAPSEDFDRLVQSVHALLGRAAPPAPPSPPPPAARRGWWRLAVAGAVLIAVALWLLAHRAERARTTPSVSATAPPPTATLAARVAATAGPAPTPIAAAAATAAAGGSGGAPPAAGAIAVAIGDPIDEGVPVAGAGSIAAAYAQTAYVFDAQPRETVFFRARAFDSGMSGIAWKLTDSTGKELFNTCFGCSNPGVIELRQGGRYTLTVGGGDAATGVYSLRLTRVPPPDRVAVELGSTPIRIAEGIPADGAGVIEAPGARDLFTFSAPPKALVGIYVDSVGKDVSGLRLQLLDSDGEALFDSCLGCSNPGVVQLRAGGTYTLAVGGNADPATGPYALRILSVPPPTRFDLGALSGSVRIAAGRPGPGAGEIETPGALDVYAFSVPAHARVAVHIVNSAPGMSGISLRIVDGDGNAIHDSCLGCSDPGALDLLQGGTYSVTVGSDKDPATGTYELELGRLDG